MKTQILTLALLSTALSAAIPAQRRQTPTLSDAEKLDLIKQKGLVPEVLELLLGPPKPRTYEETPIGTGGILHHVSPADVANARRQTPSQVADAVAASPETVHRNGLIDDVLDAVLGGKTIVTPEIDPNGGEVDGLTGGSGVLGSLQTRDDGDDDNEVDHQGLFGKAADGVGNFVFGEDDNLDDDENDVDNDDDDDDETDGGILGPLGARDIAGDDVNRDHHRKKQHGGLVGGAVAGVDELAFGTDGPDGPDGIGENIQGGLLRARDVVGDDDSDFEAATHGGIIGGVVDGIGNSLFGQDNEDNTHRFVHDVPEVVAEPVAVTPAVAPVAVTPAVAPVAAKPVAAAPVAAAPVIAAAPLKAPVGASNIVPAAVNTVANAAGAVPAAL